jgi:hypothetical protein
LNETVFSNISSDLPGDTALGNSEREINSSGEVVLTHLGQSLTEGSGKLDGATLVDTPLRPVQVLKPNHNIGNVSTESAQGELSPFVDKFCKLLLGCDAANT